MPITAIANPIIPGSHRSAPDSEAGDMESAGLKNSVVVSMKNKRKAHRKKTKEFIEIHDRETDEFIGKLLDLSTKGMMILAMRSMITQTIYEIRIDLPKPIKGKHHLTFDAECVWCCESTISKMTYNAGFQITEIHSVEIKTLQLLLDDSLFYEAEEQPRLTLAKKST